MPNVNINFGVTLYGKYVRETHIDLAKGWLEKQTWRKYQYLDFPSGWVKAIGLKKPIIANKTDEGACTTFTANWGSETDKAKLKESQDPPYFPNSSSSTITFSKWLTTLAMVRQLFMHEQIEVYNLIAYAMFDEPVSRYDGTQLRAHNMANEFTSQYRFETDSERRIRQDNIDSCKDDLRRILKVSAFISLVSLGFCATVLAAVSGILYVINSQNYIPGYCEAYVPYGYENKDLSSIAYIFDLAKRAGLKLNR
ncbi:hypothetical protein JXM67_13490 [candidate division WOR-3 bacterium]|nr:hypothetical protein [candidate division WOR-3 bacterium]